LKRLVLLVAALTATTLPAGATETWVCWSATELDPNYGWTKTVTRCRIGGSAIVDYDQAIGESPPVFLYPNVGADSSGTCWYWTSQRTNWVLLGYDSSGRAILGYDPDGIPGGPIVLQAYEFACTSEPVEVPSPLEEAYEVLSSYEHPPPDPLVNPAPGLGVTGMETFIRADPPQPWSDSIVSPITGLTIDVEAWVEALAIDWGDGTETVIPAELFPLLTGYPDGIEPHVYEVKTCDPPGGLRCHPSLSSYTLTLSYLWEAQYRVDGGEWTALAVDPTVTVIDYPVSEIIGVITSTN